VIDYREVMTGVIGPVVAEERPFPKLVSADDKPLNRNPVVRNRYLRWQVSGWGQVDEHFIVSLGEGNRFFVSGNDLTYFHTRCRLVFSPNQVKPDRLPIIGASKSDSCFT
jgi:hypothetical protein